MQQVRKIFYIGTMTSSDIKYKKDSIEYDSRITMSNIF